MDEVTLTVDGWPPVKNEAKSMLAPGHTHVDRVVKLLEAARAAISAMPGPVFGTDPVGIELIVRSSAEPIADATNFLGGVGDVLEAKSRRGTLAHLGELANVELYANDRQIHNVVYRWEPAVATSYFVRLWRL